MLNAKRAEYVAYRLSKTGADDDPAIPFTVKDGLGKVCDGGECKKNDEENIGSKVRAKRP